MKPCLNIKTYRLIKSSLYIRCIKTVSLKETSKKFFAPSLTCGENMGQ